MRIAFWLLLIAAIVLTAIGVAPLVVATTANVIATAHGCMLDEGSVHTCMINGSDWGPRLFDMFGVGWMTFVTIWLAVLAIPLWVAWVFVTVVRILRHNERRAAAAGAVR